MRLARFASLVCLAGCASAVSSSPAEDDQELTTRSPAEEVRACEAAATGTDHRGAPIVRCTKPFATAPFVRPPADTMTGETVSFYAGLTVPSTFGGIAVIWARDGKRYVAVDASGTPIPFGTGGLPAPLDVPTNRITLSVYEVTGKLGAERDTPYGKATAITLTKVRAAIEIDGCALDSRLLGAWSGTVSARLETPTGNPPIMKSFDESKRVPIHLTLAEIRKGSPLAEYEGGTAMNDAATYVLAGTIDNFESDVTIGDKTYPALAAMGAENPFVGAEGGRIELYRLGNMHGLSNDGHWVFTYPKGSTALSLNGMSYTLTAFTAPALFLDANVSAPPLESLEIRPHIPFVANGHTIVIEPEAIGARMGACPQ